MKDRFVESLSHGMKQRVGIARTLLHDPQVLILDEPANGLDPQARIEMRQLLLRLAEMGKTLIVTSHILPELSRICHLVAIVTKGKLRAFGTLQDILREINQRRTFEVQLLDASKLASARDVIQSALNGEGGGDASVSEAEATVRFDSQLQDDHLAALLAQLIDQGISVTQFREIATDLEDAFLTVTRRDEQESLAAAEGK
jgi:ABC-2 type transport system ATP-binding protein